MIITFCGVTGTLEENLVFVVDNSPSENPSSSMVQMCLKRLCKFLNLERVTPVSFPEYNSKQNFVKRVHSQVNKALSAHGAFSSHTIHPDVRAPGRPEHIENMEKMTRDVMDSLKWAKFGKKFIEVYQGLKEDNWIFNDQKDIKKLCSLSELGEEASSMSYQARQTPLAQSLHDVWGIYLDHT